MDLVVPVMVGLALLALVVMSSISLELDTRESATAIMGLVIPEVDILGQELRQQVSQAVKLRAGTTSISSPAMDKSLDCIENRLVCRKAACLTLNPQSRIAASRCQRTS